MPDPRSVGDIVNCRFWQGVTGDHEATKAEIRYFAAVKRVPVTAFPRTRAELSAMAMEWDESPESVRRGLPASIPVSMQGWEPIPSGTIERFEAFDRETGDLLIIWRIPCRRSG